MKTCPFCSKSNPETAEQCSNCGTWLGRQPQAAGEQAEGRPAPPRPLGDAALDAQLVALLRDGKRIEAIKLYREQKGASLSEATEAINALAASHEGAGSNGIGCGLSLTLVLVICVALLAAAAALVLS